MSGSDFICGPGNNPPTECPKCGHRYHPSVEIHNCDKPFIPTRCGHANCVQPAEYRLTTGCETWLTCGEHILYALHNAFDAGNGCLVQKYTEG